MKSATPNRRGVNNVHILPESDGKAAQVFQLFANVFFANEYGIEAKYKQKCRDLRKRIHEIEEHNELVGVSITRTKRDIKRLRLERSLLLEKLEERTLLKVDDSDGSPSPPNSPTLAASVAEAAAIKKSSGETGSPLPDEYGSPSPAAKKVAGPKKPSTNGREAQSEANEIDDEESNEGGATPSTPVPQSKKRAPPRDPNLPKRPQNAYIIFCDLEKERVKREVEEANPGHPFDLTKAMAEKWHELSDGERQQYYQIYEDDKERYAREMVAYHIPNPSPSEQKEKQRAEKTLRDIEKRKEGKKPTPSSSLGNTSPLGKADDGPTSAESASSLIKEENEPVEPSATGVSADEVDILPPSQDTYESSIAEDVEMKDA